MKESVQLKQENLQLLSKEIVRPKYDRSRMKAVLCILEWWVSSFA
jgi:hypothetical protein